MTAAPPPARSLPAAELVFSEISPRPPIKAGDDARLALRKAFDWGDELAQKYSQSRQTYEAIRDQYGKPPP